MRKENGWYFDLLLHYSYGADGIVAVLDQVQCSSAEYLVLLQCMYNTDIRSTCNDDNDVTVDCCKLEGEREIYI